MHESSSKVRPLKDLFCPQSDKRYSFRRSLNSFFGQSSDGKTKLDHCVKVKTEVNKLGRGIFSELKAWERINEENISISLAAFHILEVEQCPGLSAICEVHEVVCENWNKFADYFKKSIHVRQKCCELHVRSVIPFRILRKKNIDSKNYQDSNPQTWPYSFKITVHMRCTIVKVILLEPTSKVIELDILTTVRTGVRKAFWFSSPKFLESRNKNQTSFKKHTLAIIYSWKFWMSLKMEWRSCKTTRQVLLKSIICLIYFRWEGWYQNREVHILKASFTPRADLNFATSLTGWQLTLKRSTKTSPIAEGTLLVADLIMIYGAI